MHESCKNCKFIGSVCNWGVIDYYCKLNSQTINFPRFIDGSKRCECYVKEKRVKNKFIYPTKGDLLEFLVKKEE